MAASSNMSKPTSWSRHLAGGPPGEEQREQVNVGGGRGDGGGHQVGERLLGGGESSAPLTGAEKRGECWRQTLGQGDAEQAEKWPGLTEQQLEDVSNPSQPIARPDARPFLLLQQTAHALAQIRILQTRGLPGHRAQVSR